MSWDTTKNMTQMDGWICLLLDVSIKGFLQYQDEPT